MKKVAVLAVLAVILVWAVWREWPDDQGSDARRSCHAETFKFCDAWCSDITVKDKARHVSCAAECPARYRRTCDQLMPAQ
jgi:hypothetical protein